MKLLASLSLLIVLSSCSSTPDAGPPPIQVDGAGILRLPDGAQVEGLLQAREIHLAAGATATVVGDAMLLGADLVLIEGTLRVADAARRPGRVDAPSLQLVSEGAIVTLGKILGGRGADRTGDDFLPRRGGRGSSILLDAPDQTPYGELRAGDGGAGWAGGTGGEGGCLYFVGGQRGAFDSEPYAERIAAAAKNSGGYGGVGGTAGRSEVRALGAGTGGSGGGVNPEGAVAYFADLPSQVKSLFDR